MPEYIVVDQIAVGEADPNVEGAVNHRHYMRGERVELSQEVGDAYVADGAVRPVDPPEQPAPSELSEEDKEAQRLLDLSASQTPAERSNEDKSGLAEKSSSSSSTSSASSSDTASTSSKSKS